MAQRRLGKELSDITKKPNPNFDLSPNGDDLFNWTCSIRGPAGSPYEGGIFRVQIELPTDYPFKPPKVKFNTTIYHPNVSDGNICMEVLKADGWSPSVMLADVMGQLAELLREPNADQPLDAECAEQFKNNYEGFVAKARQMTQEHAVI